MLLRNAVLHRYPVFGIASLALAACDAFGTAWKLSASAKAALVLFLQLLPYVAPWYLSAGLVASAALAGATWVGAKAVDQGLPVPSERYILRDGVLATIPVLSGFFLLQYTLTLGAATTFRNHELGSLLAALAAIVALFALGGLWLGLFVAVRAARGAISRAWLRALILWPAALAMPGFAVFRVVRANWDGFRILGGWMFVGPAVAIVAAIVASVLLARASERRTLQARKVALGVLVGALPVAAAMSFVNSDLALRAVDGGLWSKVILTSLRAATDVDRDGYSSFFSGGDCAPFNRAINPGARDIPGDGIDQNCLGGDAVLPGKETGPRWHAHPPGEGRAKNLIVVTIEAMRADKLAVLGYPSPNTPNLQRLAERSALFKVMYSGSSATPLSLASIWTSTSPSHIKVAKGEKHEGINRSMPWLPELLQKAGFATAAILGDYLAFDPAQWDMGFNRGFSNYDITTHIDQRGGNFYGFPAAEMVPKACRWLDSLGSRRFFLWTHFVEPHQKYEPHPKGPRFGDSEEQLYASDVWSADYEVGNLIQCLEQRQMMDSTVIVVTGDHGESLGDHGFHGHYASVFEPEVRTLGLIYVPGMGPKTVAVPAVHEDLAPTLLNLLGVREGFDQLRGRNLVPALLGFSVEPTTFFVELEGFRSLARAVAFLDPPYKMIHTRGTLKFALFDVVQDPGEQTDLAGTRPEIANRMKDEIIRYLETAVSN